MRKGIRAIFIIVLVLCLLCACLWFIPCPPGKWGKQEASLGYTGAFEINDELDGISLLSLGGYSRPETVLYRDGYVYAGVNGGVLLRMKEDGSEIVKLLDTGGCILGFEFDNEGNLLVTDCNYKGGGAIIKLDASSGTSSALISRETGTELYYPNAIVVAKDGTIYFTDSSKAFPPSKYGGDSYAAAVNEALMHTATGRVLSYEPSSGSVRVIADGMDFSNGIALSSDEKSLFVCETYIYCVKRVDIATGETETFLSNLPGYPDNLTKGLDGRYWVGLANQRSESLDRVSDKPFLRKLVWLYGKLAPSSEESGGYGCVFAFTEDGKITENLQSGSNGYYKNTGATETTDRLYIQSVNHDGMLAYLER